MYIYCCLLFHIWDGEGWIYRGHGGRIDPNPFFFLNERKRKSEKSQKNKARDGVFGQTFLTFL
jgi:hypothetical protein